MTSFNILGVCTTRDIFAETEGEKKYQIKKYTLGFSPLFAFEEGLKIDKEAFDSVEFNIAPFRRRASYLEFTHSVFDFITQEQSDYLIVDMAVLRSPYFLTEDGHYFSYGKLRRKFYDVLIEKLNYPAVKEEGIPCDFLPKDEVEKRLKAYAAKLLTLYRPDQIILCEHRHSRLNVNGNTVRPFKNFDEKWGRRIEFVDFCFGIMKNELKGCHVINYLDNAIADLKHRLGISPLHFTKHYYSYCLECIELILKKLPAEEEAVQLKKIRRKWNRLYAVSYFPMLKKFALSQFDAVERVNSKRKKKSRVSRNETVASDDECDD